MSNEVPVVRDLPRTSDSGPAAIRARSRAAHVHGLSAGRTDASGTRNFVLIVPTSMCASHEAQQIAMMAEFSIYKRERFPNVDGVVAIPHNKRLRLLGRLEHPGDAADARQLRRAPERRGRHLHRAGLREDQPDGGRALPVKHEKLDLGKPVVRFGIQETGGTQAVDRARACRRSRRCCRPSTTPLRTPAPVSDLILGVKCGGSDGFSGLSANPALGHAADLLVEQGGTVVITEVPEFCGAEHILAQRAKDRATGEAVYEMVDWYKEYASKFGTVLGENPSPGNVAGGLLNITIKSLGAIAKAGTTRVEGSAGTPRCPPARACG